MRSSLSTRVVHYLAIVLGIRSLQKSLSEGSMTAEAKKETASFLTSPS